MANGDEYMMPGGIYDLSGECRTDVYLKESGPGTNEAAGTPMTFDLGFVTGNASIHIVECKPEDIARLGAWLMFMAKTRLLAAEPIPGTPPVTVVCPDCGQVSVTPDAVEGGRGISGLCPTCGERLYFG